jgi:ATP-dependent helicase/nuclease subunit A
MLSGRLYEIKEKVSMTPKFYPTLFQHLATDYQRNLAVTAGAGTGKTEVLTRRIIKILAQERHCLDRLLVLTFTDKAAVEMKERIYGAIETELAQTKQPHFQKLKDTFLNNYISTFHSFCAALLREYPIEAGIDPYFRVLDETDKVFFLRKSISRSLKELAADKTNRAIRLLSGEFSRSSLAAALFAIIQKREDTGPWITDFSKLDLADYKERLLAYRECILREMAYKLHRSQGMELCLQQLKAIGPDDPGDESALSRKHRILIKLIPQLLEAIAPAISGPVDAGKIMAIKKEMVENIKLPTSIPKAWSEEAAGALRASFLSLRYLLKSFPVEEFEIIESHEKCGFELLKALAGVTQYCLQAYHDDKTAVNYLDFQDLQIKVLHLFQTGKHRHILDELRERFRFIMVDEFQDTNDIQWQIIKKIATDQTETIVNPKLFVVGDEKQAIYSFRGGDVSLFSRVRRELFQANQEGGHNLQPFNLQFCAEKDYEAEYREKVTDDSVLKGGEIIFSDNFRSAAVPINFFNMFFHDLLSRVVYEEYDAKPQRLICSGNKAQGSVELLLVDGGGATVDESLDLNSEERFQQENPGAGIELKPHFKEALLIVDKIKEVFFGDDEKYLRVRESARKGRPAVAILLNRRTMIKTYEEALRLNRIEFTVVRGRGFFQRQEIVDLGNLLRFLVNPTDDLALTAFLRSPAGHVSDAGIFRAAKQSDGACLWEKIQNIALELESNQSRGFSDRDQEALLHAFRNLTRWLELSGRMPLVEFLRMILHDGVYYVSLCRGIRGDQAVSNIEKLLDGAREMMLVEGGDLADFCQWLNERIDYIEEEGEADIDISLGGAVQIMTVHQSKGLEFPLVFVPDLGAGFNLGEHESLYTGLVPVEMRIIEEGIIRQEIPEIGLDASNPEKEWESEPILIKRIIKKRLKDKLIAEKKRLLYVAATRAMDHLVLVGHSDFSSPGVIQRVTFAPLDQLTNWMDWINRILGISFLADGVRGEILYGNEAGEPLKIPYRKFMAEGALPSGADEYRTEFPEV